MRTVIVGGGLVGLTTAASLKLVGHEVTVLEQAPEVRAAGAGIGLWPNALREFDRIGVGTAVRALGSEIDTWFHDAAGRRIRAAGFDVSDHRFLLVPRPALNGLLADAVGRDRIRLDAHATGYTEDEAEAVVHLSDGSELRADLLIGADGVYSRVRAQLVPGSDAAPHAGHYAWRALVPAGDERPEGTVLTVGEDRTRGGYARVSDGQTMWMVNQFEAGPLTGTKRDRALHRARNLAEAGWHDDLLRMIARTPEEAILENQIMFVPPLGRWTSERVALIGDAAHGLSPHISAGGTLGIEDAGVLRACLAAEPDTAKALAQYEAERTARFDQVRVHADAVERAADAEEFAARYAAFSHWMLTTAPTV
ncbi:MULTISPECIES: FAD-dependent monooxygenase [unclassified Streptomyces]|uniref:FAD-dependent monooxygenase n=1 Tax=unclassified Streptomyces TaxID=2593676 RepID=UPI0034472F15